MIIPETVYEEVERKLRRRDSLIKRAEEDMMRAQAEATDISAPSGPGTGRKGGIPGSRTERGALKLIRAEKRMKTALEWVRIFKEMDRIYPSDSNEGFVASMIYGNGLTQAELARVCNCSRQTVKLRQDRYVIRAAFLATQAGLIKKGVFGYGDADQAERGAEEN